MRTTYLVSCVSKKRATPTAAKHLYISDWFIKARAYVEQQEARWYILSAEHGLLHPDKVIGRYDTTLNRMKAAERKEWAAIVLGQLEQVLEPGDQTFILAGQRYREYLMEPLNHLCSSVETPLARLGIGQQLAWFKQRISP
jgi:hypothetical protein